MTPAGRAHEERVRLLRVDPRVHDAAYIGARFGLDPVAVLGERDPWRQAVRVAAAALIADDEAKASRRR